MKDYEVFKDGESVGLFSATSKSDALIKAQQQFNANNGGKIVVRRVYP